jgi:hypothetical protein
MPKGMLSAAKTDVRKSAKIQNRLRDTRIEGRLIFFVFFDEFNCGAGAVEIAGVIIIYDTYDVIGTQIFSLFL